MKTEKILKELAEEIRDHHKYIYTGDNNNAIGSYDLKYLKEEIFNDIGEMLIRIINNNSNEKDHLNF